MGYTEAATTLSRESRYELEDPLISAFRKAVLEGRWAEAECTLMASQTAGGSNTISGSNSVSDGPAGLVLAEGADKSQMLFWMRQQKFLEFLDQRELGKALTVLRQELTPLNHDMHQLHALSR